MKHLTYKGAFLSRQNHTVEVEIYAEAEQAPATVGELRFPAEEPVVIEWEHRDKHEPLCGSTATVTLISPADRTYIGLYTIRPGDISVRILRDGALWWTGTLDPEFYEEPYTASGQYDVTLTFSDLGILDRLPFALAGTPTLHEVVSHAVSRAGLGELRIVQDLVSTRLTAGSSLHLMLPDLQVRADNFFDEDGTPMTLMEALEGILQPLALRMEQRAGALHIYDLNGLHSLAPRREVCWTDSDQTLTTDRVANNVKVTFSPYATSVLFSDEPHYKGLTEGDGTLPDGSSGYWYYPNASTPSDYNWDYGDVSFRFFRGGECESKCTVSGSWGFVKPGFDGEEQAVLAAFFCSGHGGRREEHGTRVTSASAGRIISLPPVRLPKLDGTLQGSTRLRLSLGLMADARYNPYTEAANNFADNDNWLRNAAHWMFIPFEAVLKDDSGTVLYHYENYSERHSDRLEPHIKYTTGSWVEGGYPAGTDHYDAVLAYYNKQDYGGAIGSMGWRTNAHTLRLNRSQVKLRPSWMKIADGQYMDYPPAGGTLEIHIRSGAKCYEPLYWSAEANPDDILKLHEPADRLRWMLYKMPKLEMVQADSMLSDYPAEDVEHSGLLNANAREDIEIDTVCGTLAVPNPCARGVYYHASGGGQVNTLARAGRTAEAEQLLIGTLYSQYAGRHTRLQGTAALTDGGLALLTDAAQPAGRVFMVTADVQDLIADEREVELTELSPDLYEAEGE